MRIFLGTTFLGEEVTGAGEFMDDWAVVLGRAVAGGPRDVCERRSLRFSKKLK